MRLEPQEGAESVKLFIETLNGKSALRLNINNIKTQPFRVMEAEQI